MKRSLAPFTSMHADISFSRRQTRGKRGPLFSLLLCGISLALLVAGFPGGPLMLEAHAQDAQGQAPLTRTKGFYVNDYASVIFSEHRDSIFGFCTDLNEATGAQVVVATVKDFGGMDGESYGKLLMEGWDIGDPAQRNGALILVSSGGEVLILAEEGLDLGDTQAIIAEYMQNSIENANFSKGILEGTKEVITRVYKQYGIAPGEELAHAAKSAKTGGFPATAAVMMAGVLLLVGRSMQIAHNTRKKYGKGYVYKRKRYAPAPPQDDFDTASSATYEPDDKEA